MLHEAGKSFGMKPFGDEGRLARMEAGWRIEDERRTCPIPRLDRFPDLSMVRTSAARLTAVIVRADVGAAPAFHLLADSTSAGYFLTCLRDAAEEFGGRMTGLSKLEEMLSGSSSLPWRRSSDREEGGKGYAQ